MINYVFRVFFNNWGGVGLVGVGIKLFKKYKKLKNNPLPQRCFFSDDINTIL